MSEPNRRIIRDMQYANFVTRTCVDKQILLFPLQIIDVSFVPRVKVFFLHNENSVANSL